MSASGDEPSTAQIANPLVQATLLGEAVDAADLAVVVFDEDGRCIAVNQGACRLLGYTRDDLLELGVQDLAPELDAGACFRTVYETGRADGVVQALRGDGARMAIRHRSTPTRVARMPLVLSLGRAEAAGGA